MIVNMPVTCIGPICQNCPELDIDITSLYADFGSTVATLLTCKHYERCRQLKEYLETNREENKE